MNTTLLFRARLLAGTLLLLAAPFTASSQGVGIGTTSPDASAALDIQAADKGLLIPRLTAAQRTASGAPQSGFWYFAGSPAAWVFLNPAGAADNLGKHTATTDLNLQDNALT